MLTQTADLQASTLCCCSMQVRLKSCSCTWCHITHQQAQNLCSCSLLSLADCILPLQMGATPPTSSALAPHKRSADYSARLSNSSLLATHPGDATASDETDGSDSAGQVLHAEEVPPFLLLPKHRLCCCWHHHSVCWHC